MNEIVKKNIDIINYLIQNNTFRERLEYIKAYEFGMDWMENLDGGYELHQKYNELKEVAECDNNIVVDYVDEKIVTSTKSFDFGVDYVSRR